MHLGTCGSTDLCAQHGSSMAAAVAAACWLATKLWVTASTRLQGITAIDVTSVRGACEGGM